MILGGVLAIILLAIWIGVWSKLADATDSDFLTIFCIVAAILGPAVIVAAIGG